MVVDAVHLENPGKYYLFIGECAMRTGDKDYILLDCECGKKLKTESCNIGSRILCPECNEKILVPDEFATYHIKFGSAFSRDKFGFVGIGKMDIGMKTVWFTGKRKWSALARTGIFLAITVLPLLLFGFGLGIILALLVVGYFCVSSGSVSLSRIDFQNGACVSLGFAQKNHGRPSAADITPPRSFS